jgi:class 3 adenylate cyclase
VLIVVISLLSLALAQVFVRPVRGLVGAVRRVAGGDLNVEVPTRSRDEFGDLGGAFNDMSRSLRVKQELIDKQKEENDKLLRTLMPDAVAERYREGEEAIAESHEDVSVLFADLNGFDEFAAGLTSEQEIGVLNGLVASFDESAARLGVETVRTLREGYLASCGLVVPRVDNVRRMVDFAQDLTVIIERFNAQQGASLSLRIGIDAGTVSSGLVGRTSLAYDLWGDAVSLASQIQSVAGKPGIYVSLRVHDKMQDTVTMTQVGSIERADGAQSIWQVK